MTTDPHWHPETLAISAGRDPAPGAPLSVPPHFASTFRDGGANGYGRWGNPSWTVLEEALGALEGGQAVTFASGVAGVAAVLAQLPTGARVVAPSGAYLGSRSIVHDLEHQGRITLRLIDTTDNETVLANLEGTDLLWLESPTNPRLGIVDLPFVLAAATRAGVTTAVDSTFATPMVQRPLTWGATYVVHSATKYLGGHSDLLLGAVIVADASRREQLVARRTLDGAIPGVMESYLALRGLRTLPVRFARQQESAGVLAERLSRHPRVELVRYPGLVSDPFHERARAQMTGFGAMVSFDVTDAETADRVAASVRLIVGGTSLGGVETTIDRRGRWPGEDVPPGLLRLSVGLEHPEDLWNDLDTALHAS